MVGDIFSFPSESAIKWVEEKLKKIDLPYVYTAGNHDWHYEGMEGTSTQLRSTWIQKRLLPLYQGSNPLMSSKEIHGIRFVTIDNSNYEILPEQLAFFNKEKQLGKPILLMVHIPLFASERPLGFGCGHPDWNAKNDRNFKLERRLPWSETGHSKTTMEFHKEVFRSENLLGILAGHIHEQSLDVVNGIPQIVTQANATGAYLHVEFVP